MENGGKKREKGSESDEEDDDNDHQRNTSDPGTDGSHQSANLGSIQVNELSGIWFSGPGWTANFRDCREAAASQSLPDWDTTGSGAQTRDSGWANFAQFQPFSG